MMRTMSKTSKPFTGWHMLVILVAFFGVVIAVNVTMATYASTSWSGLISKDTYVASQDFNVEAAKARGWAAEGFKGVFNVDADTLEYSLTGPAAKIDGLMEIFAFFSRPVGDKQDVAIKLARVGNGLFAAKHQLAAGQWIVDLAAIQNGKTVFHQAERIQLPERVK